MAKYAEVESDFQRLGIFAQALEGVSLAQQEAALSSACQFAEGYFNNRFMLPLVWKFLVLQTRSASGNGSAVEIFDATRLPLALDIVSIDSGLSLAVEVQESLDGLSPWTVVGSFATAAEAGHFDAEFTPTKPFVRIVWVLTGTGNIRFGVSFEGSDLKRAVCDIASYHLLTARGLDPQANGELLSERYENAMKWLKDVRGNRANPDFIDQTPTTEENIPIVFSKPRRR